MSKKLFCCNSSKPGWMSEVRFCLGCKRVCQRKYGSNYVIEGVHVPHQRNKNKQSSSMLEEVKEHEYDHGHSHGGGECHDHNAPGHSHGHSHVNVKNTLKFIGGSIVMMTKNNPKPLVFAALTSFAFFALFL